MENEKTQKPVQFYKKLTKQARELAKKETWSTTEKKLDELSKRWSSGPKTDEEEEEEKIKDLFYKFTKATEAFENRKKEHFKKREKQKKENLSSKKIILKDLQKIVDDENWSAKGKVKNIQKRWQNISAVPQNATEDLKAEYERLIKEFKSHKLDNLVEKRQKQQDNLMLKMIVLDKMEKVIADMNEQTTNWKKVDSDFDDLTKQWKKIGRVPREKANKTWSRYKTAQDNYYDAKYKYDKEHQKKVDKFSAKKKKLCRQAEGLVDQESLLKASRKVNKLHQRWKKAGNLHQRKEDKLWDRFKAAIDAFNQKKADNIEHIQEQEEANYQKKQSLIAEAKDLKETTDWKKGHKQMQELMGRWKKSGPVSPKQSNKLWKQFKGAMDVFYDRRRNFFKESKKRQKENLKEKEDLLEKLRELGRHEDPIEAVNKAKPLQAKFKEVGYVPIKKKNEMWKRYRETCDVIYNRYRAAKSGDKFDKELAKAKLGHEQRSKIQQIRKKHKKVEKEVKELKEEVLQFQESKSYFTSSDEDNPLLKEMQQKIDKAQAKLDSKQDRLAALNHEMEEIKENEI